MITTKRLQLRPLNAEELQLAANDPAELDKHLNLTVRAYPQAAPQLHVKKALEYRRQMVLKYPEAYEWYTEWELIKVDEQLIIGGIMLMSEKNEGEVEIGYGIDEKYQNKGYMTEAVCALINWMFEKSHTLEFVVAETEKENIASQKVLINAGMARYKETEECIWWRIGRKA